MPTITSNGKNFEIKDTVQIEFNGKMQDAHLCEDGKIYTQNHKREWVNKENAGTVQQYGNFLLIHAALEKAEEGFN